MELIEKQKMYRIKIRTENSLIEKNALVIGKNSMNAISNFMFFYQSTSSEVINLTVKFIDYVI